MAILSKGTDFSTGDQVTAAKLDALVDNATFASGAVDDSTTQLDASGRVIVKDGGVTISKLSTGGPQWNSDGQVAIKGDALSIEGKGTNAGLEINSLVTGDGVAFIDFHFDASTEPDYDARIANDSSKNFILQNASHGKDCIIQTTKSDGTLVNGLKVDSEGSVTCTNNVIVDNGLADGGQVQFNSQGNNSLSIDNNAGNLRVLNETTASELVRVEAGGDVGIGTNDPSSKLHVAGTIKSVVGTGAVELNGSDGSIEITRAVSSGTGAFIDFKAVSSDDNDCRIEQTDDDGLAFSTGGEGSVAKRVTILKGGNVGIGTTTPGSELEVNGNVTAATPTADTHLATKAYVDLLRPKYIVLTGGTTGLTQSSEATYQYNIADFTGSGLTATNISQIHILCNLQADYDACGTNSRVQASYPNDIDTLVPIFQTNRDSGGDSTQNFSSLVTVPINASQSYVKVGLEFVTGGSFQIVGATVFK